MWYLKYLEMRLKVLLHTLRMPPRNRVYCNYTDTAVYIDGAEYINIELTPDPNLDKEFDAVSINIDPAAEKELQVIKISADTQKLAKVYAYALAVPESEAADTAIAARARLQDQGYKVQNLGSERTRSSGIFLFALCKPGQITVLCRGTQGDASIIAVLDPTAPGASVMHQDKKNILSELNQLCTEFAACKIVVTGHSLGGALAQILTQELLSVKLNTLKHSSEYPELGGITGITTIVYQSAGVSVAMAEKVEADAVSIQKLVPQFNITFVAHVNTGDLVSKTGPYLFSNTATTATVALMRVPKPSASLTLSDYLSVGCAGITAGPYGALGMLFLHGVSRQVQATVAAHTSSFYHEERGELSTPYGMSFNSDVCNAVDIQNVFARDVISEIPNAHAVKAKLHSKLSTINNEDLRHAGQCAMAVVCTITTLANGYVALQISPIHALAVGVCNLDELRASFATINRSGGTAIKCGVAVCDGVAGTYRLIQATADNSNSSDVDPNHVKPKNGP